MDYTQDAMRFVVQGEDALSPVLRTAAKNYDKYATKLEASNKRIYDVVSTGLEAVSSLVQELDDLPKRAKSAATKLAKAIAVKPVAIPVTLKLAAGSGAGTAGGKSAADAAAESPVVTAVERAVGRLLSTIELRLSPAMPSKRNPIFDGKRLRDNYKGMVHPPDLIGFFKNLPKFAKGTSRVPGPNLPPSLQSGTDKTLAILTPGEMVIPAEIAKEIGTLRSASGTFSKQGPAIKDIAIYLEDAARAAEKWAKLAASGLDPKAPEMYRKSVENVAKAQKELTTATKELASESKSHLLPYLERASTTLKEYNDQLDQQTRLEKVLAKLIGPARYLALSHALGVVTGKMSELRGAASDASDQLGTHALDSFVDDLNASNKVLNLSRGELRTYKASLADAAQQAGVSVGTVGEATRALVEAGVRGKDALTKLAPLTAQIVTATGQSTEDVAKMVYESDSLYGESADQIKSIVVAQKKLAAEAAVSMDEMSKGVDAFRNNLGNTFATLPADAKKRLETGASTFVASLGQNFAPIGDKMLGEIANAVQNLDPDSIQRLQAFGVAFDDAKDAVSTGDFTKVVAGLQGRMVQLSKSGELAGAVAKNLGLELDGKQLAAGVTQLTNAKDTYAQLARVAETSTATAGAELATMVKNNQTWAESLKVTVTNWASSMGLDTLYDGLKEVNPQMLLAVGYLGKIGVEGVVAGVKLGAKLVPALGGMAKTLLGLGSAGKAVSAATSAATAVEGAAGGAGAGGFLRGLAGGLAAFAQPQVILGTAVVGVTLAGGMIALGYAMKLAAPGIVAATPALTTLFTVIGDVAKTGIVEGFKFLTDFAHLPAANILATAGALLATGPALAGIGVGATAMGTGLLLAVPGLFAFSRVAGYLQGDGAAGAKGLGATVTAIMDAVDVDAAKAKAANDRMSDVAGFVSRLAYTMAGLAALQAGSLVGGAVDKVASYFGADQKTQIIAFVHNTQDIVDATVTASQSLNVAPAAAAVAAKAFDAAAGLVTASRPLYAAVRAAGAEAQGLQQGWGDWFAGKDGPLDALILAAPKVSAFVNASAADFARVGDLSASMAGVQQAAAMVQAAAPLYTAVGTVADAAQGMDASLWQRVTGQNGALDALTNNSPRVMTFLGFLSGQLAGLSQGSLVQNADGITQAIGSAARMVVGYRGLLSSIAGAGELADGAGSAADAMRATVGKNASLVQELQKSFLYSPDASKTITLQLQANDDDKRQTAAMEAAVQLLTQIVTMMAQGKPLPPGALAALGGRSILDVVAGAGNAVLE